MTQEKLTQLIVIIGAAKDLCDWYYGETIVNRAATNLVHIDKMISRVRQALNDAELYDLTAIRMLKEALVEPVAITPHEAVNHPAHYGGDTPYETIKVIEAWGLDGDFCLGNAIKYISRAHRKGKPVEDLKKALWYLQRRIQQMDRPARLNPPDMPEFLQKAQAALETQGKKQY